MLNSNLIDNNGNNNSINNSNGTKMGCTLKCQHGLTIALIAFTGGILCTLFLSKMIDMDSKNEFLYSENVLNENNDNSTKKDIDHQIILDIIKEKWKDKEIVDSIGQKVSIIQRCETILNNYKKKDLKQQKETWSQAFQDIIIYHNFFKGQTVGTYLDIGANQPHFLSNTAFFDFCLGWNGVCIEPTNAADAFGKRERHCNVFKGCIWNKGPTKLHISQIKGDGLTHITNDGKYECNADAIQNIINQYTFNSWKTESLNFTNHKSILIDFISMDIEGQEVNILKCWPFDRINAKVWTIETNAGNNYNILVDEIMLNNGYSKYQFIFSAFDGSHLDSVYIKRDDSNWITVTDAKKTISHCDNH